MRRENLPETERNLTARNILEARRRQRNHVDAERSNSLRASSRIWASETSLPRTRERAAKPRGAGKESLQQSLINFHLYFTQTKGNSNGWKMTFRNSKLIDNRPGWHPLRLCVKFGSQGDQIGTENLFQPNLRSMAVLSSRAQSPRGFSALARLYYSARPTKTAMLRRLVSALRRARFICNSRKKEYCVPRINRSEFVVLVEGKWKLFIGCIHLCQAPC